MQRNWISRYVRLSFNAQRFAQTFRDCVEIYFRRTGFRHRSKMQILFKIYFETGEEHRQSGAPIAPLNRVAEAPWRRLSLVQSAPSWSNYAPYEHFNRCPVCPRFKCQTIPNSQFKSLRVGWATSFGKEMVNTQPSSFRGSTKIFALHNVIIPLVSHCRALSVHAI